MICPPDTIGRSATRSPKQKIGVRSCNAEEEEGRGIGKHSLRYIAFDRKWKDPDAAYVNLVWRQGLKNIAAGSHGDGRSDKSRSSLGWFCLHFWFKIKASVSAKRSSGISATLAKARGVHGVAVGSCPVTNRFSTSSDGCHNLAERQ
jgi:hypothetical protein